MCHAVSFMPEECNSRARAAGPFVSGSSEFCGARVVGISQEGIYRSTPRIASQPYACFGVDPSLGQPVKLFIGDGGLGGDQTSRGSHPPGLNRRPADKKKADSGGSRKHPTGGS